MANNRNDHVEGQDEGEYHFSDDQLNYEMDETAPAPEETKMAAPKISPIAMIQKYRRQLVGVGVLLVIIFIVYRMVAPSSPPTTEFSATPPPVQAVAPQQSQNQKVAMQTPVAAPQPQPTPAAQPALPAEAPATPASKQSSPQMPAAASDNVLDKVTALEQQNAKLTYLIETELPQRMTTAEQQNAALSSKMQDLTTRVANIEDSLNQLTQLLQGGALKPADASAGQQQSAAPKTAETKIMYTVQAIIPGRAWLKSDSGETITVAVDDQVKELGKVTKIDPYDGIVEIDTGTKIVTLTYGGGGGG